MRGQIAYNRLWRERGYGDAVPSDGSLPDGPPVPRRPPQRSSPEVRASILEMFKQANGKYAKPFENRLAMMSIFGGNWEEYGAIVLQMTILDTLLSIEEKLTGPVGTQAAPDGHDAGGAYAAQHRAGVPGSFQP
jgi:hypothetical protein